MDFSRVYNRFPGAELSNPFWSALDNTLGAARLDRLLMLQRPANREDNIPDQLGVKVVNLAGTISVVAFRDVAKPYQAQWSGDPGFNGFEALLAQEGAPRVAADDVEWLTGTRGDDFFLLGDRNGGQTNLATLDQYGYGGGLSRIDAGGGDDVIWISFSKPGVSSLPEIKGTVLGGSGDDFIHFEGATRSKADGGAGRDRIVSLEADISRKVVIDGGGGNDRPFAIQRLLEVMREETTFEPGDTSWQNAQGGGLWGFHGKDVIDGGGGHDLIVGGVNKDVLKGGPGNDVIFTDSVLGDTYRVPVGNDVAKGGPGDDMIFSGLGRERLFGGGGNDTFVLVEDGDRSFHEDSLTIIKDFRPGDDRIEFWNPNGSGEGWIDEELAAIRRDGRDTLIHLRKTEAVFTAPGVVGEEVITDELALLLMRIEGVRPGELEADSIVFL